MNRKRFLKLTKLISPHCTHGESFYFFVFLYPKKNVGFSYMKFMEFNQTNFLHPCGNESQIQSTGIFSAKFRFSTGMTMLIYFIYLLPFCFGVFGNISVCLIFFQQRKLRSITNTFLMNLCKSSLAKSFHGGFGFFFQV